jgi:hypothetical protein
MDPMLKRSLLVGATPLLFGILSGNTVEGAQVAGENLMNEDKIALDRQKRDSKADLETMLANSRLKRELARNLREDTKLQKAREAPLEKKHIVETEGEDGKAIITTVGDALGKEAWKKPSEANPDDFHLQEKMALETHKAGLKSPKDPTDPYKNAKNENELYRLYQHDSDTTKKMGEAYSRFRGTLTMPVSAANDLAVVFNYMKILDPGSVVREGEQAKAANATSVPDGIRNMYNRLLLGKDQSLPSGLREKFFREASAMYKQQLKSQEDIDTFFKGVAGRRGLDHRNIVRSFPQVQKDGRVKTYTNAKGEAIMIDIDKLTPRGKRDLEKDGFKEKK